jgi:dihydroorotate dehydrogenase
MDGVLLMNGIQRPVLRPDGTPAFPGAHRRLAGVSGDGTRGASLAAVREVLAARTALGLDIGVWAVGGLSTPEDLRGAAALGADATLVATAAMFDPLLAIHTKAALR